MPDTSDINELSAPIAGQSLTAELGASAWQQPAKYNTVDEALSFYSPKLMDEGFQDMLFDTMELGTPITTIANAMQSGAVMEGIHSVDLGMLIIPVLVEMMAYVADKEGIKYTLGTEKRIDEDKISSSKVALALNRLKKEADSGEQETETMEAEEAPSMDMPEEQPAGLMARRM